MDVAEHCGEDGAMSLDDAFHESILNAVDEDAAVATLPCRV